MRHRTPSRHNSINTSTFSLDKEPEMTFCDFCCFLKHYRVLDEKALDHLDIANTWRELLEEREEARGGLGVTFLSSRTTVSRVFLELATRT
jgi:hypothetical protein